MNVFRIMLIVPESMAEDFAAWERSQFGINFCGADFGPDLGEEGLPPSLYRWQGLVVDEATGTTIFEHMFALASLSAPALWGTLSVNQKALAIRAMVPDFIAANMCVDAADLSDPSTNYNKWNNLWALNELLAPIEIEE